MSVRVEKDGPVTTVILHRPEVRNAVNRPTAEALAAAFREFEADDDAHVAVLFGDGGTFCAGADLKAVSLGNKPNRAHPDGDAPLGCTRMLLDKPVIAAVAGYAVAGGLELSLWCDMRVAEENAVFGVYCRRWGVPLVDGGTVRLPRLIGQSRALDMILTGRPVEAAEALEWGLANRVVPNGQARPEAEKLAHEIAKFPPLCMRTDRRSSYEQWGLQLPLAMQNEFRLGSVPLREEARAGATRFADGKGRSGNFNDI